MSQTKILAVALVSTLLWADAGAHELLPQASAGSEGVFLSDVVRSNPDEPLPRILLTSAPPIGRPLILTRYQINDLLGKKAPELASTNWSGSERVRILRATRIVDESTLKELLTQVLQDEHVKTRGELELRFNRPWHPVLVPDDPLSLKVLELPTSGLSSSFICRFELFAGAESAGVHQQPLQARIWKDIYVAASNLTRGTLLREADLTLEKRDILSTRDYLAQVPLDDPYIEFRENVQGGAPLSARMFRLRAIVKRGKMVEALLQDEALTISVKAEALEDGVPGQAIRLRNLRSKREFKGKVQDEQTVVVMF